MKVELDLPLTPEACAELGGVSYWTILRRIKSGDLRAYQPAGGSKYVVHPEDLREWLYGTPVKPQPASSDQELPQRSPRAAPAGSLARLKGLERGAA